MGNTNHKVNIEHTNTQTAQVIHGETPGVFDTILFSNIINVLFVIVFFIWLFRKFNLLSFIAKKRDEIMETLKNLEEERRIKQNNLEQTKIKVQNVNQEITKILDEGGHVAESVSERIIKEAEEEAADMQKKAHALIETERKVASNQVVQEVSTAAFVIAEKHIREAVDDRLHDKYINEFIENLDNLKV